MRIVLALATLFLANAAWGQDSIPGPSQALNIWLSTEHLDKFLRIDTIISADGTVTVNGTMAGTFSKKTISRRRNISSAIFNFA